jgi:surfeit locus 1 family protein
MAVALLAFAGFFSLGVFQVKRLAWKDALIARVDRHVHAVPVSAPAPGAWPAVSKERDEYRRVSVQGTFAHAKETLVKASTVLGSGYWVMTPLQTAQGHWVMVNRGFVPTHLREQAQRGLPVPEGEQMVVALLRLTEPDGTWLQSNDVGNDRWYSRDVAALAAARGLGDAPVAPYFLDVVASEPSTPAAVAWPRPGLTVLHFNNNHLVYALTWFTLAAMTAGALGYLLVDERRLRRPAGDRRSHDTHSRR